MSKDFGRSLPPEVEVGIFVKHIWEHPLVSDFTRSHREQGKVSIKNFFDRHQIPETDYVAVICGSTLWLPDTASDHDFRLVAKDYDAYKKVTEVFEPISYQGDLQLLECADPYSWLSQYHVSKDLLLTPDNYLVGNLELAQRLRLRIIKEFSEREWLALTYYFNYFYKNWRQLPGHKKGKRSRGVRYAKALAVWSEQTQRPSVLFERAVTQLEPPPLRIYEAGLIASGGRIATSPFYKTNPERFSS